MGNEASSVLSTLSVEKANSPDFSHSRLRVRREKDDGSNAYAIYDAGKSRAHRRRADNLDGKSGSAIAGPLL